MTKPEFDFTFTPLRVERTEFQYLSNAGHDLGGERRIVAPEEDWEAFKERCDISTGKRGKFSCLHQTILLDLESCLDEWKGPITAETDRASIPCVCTHSDILTRVLKTIEGSKAEIWVRVASDCPEWRINPDRFDIECLRLMAAPPRPTNPN